MNRPNWIGQTLGGRYRIDDILGQGGMSAVYKAFDPNLKRVVAVKMIHPHLAEDARFRLRFEEEASAVAQLRHPNIVQIFDFNHDESIYYMVQEFVAGETLQERLRRLNKANRRLPLNEAVGFIINICAAAGYAHQRGLVHRDIKPANIMIDIHNQAILMDFGIVKILGGEKHTATGAVVGTALYLPPESIRGEVPDPRSDQYSLAVTLFEAISGRPPYEADSAMTLMMMHLNDPTPDIRQLRPDVPPGLGMVVEKALSKSREDRFSSMADFAAALYDALSKPAPLEQAATLVDPTGSITQDAPETGPGMIQRPAGRPTRPATPPSESTSKLPAPANEPPAASQAAPVASLDPPAVSAPAAQPRLKPALWAGLAGAAIMIVIVVTLLLRNAGNAGQLPVAPLPTSAPTETQVVQAIAPLVEASPTPTTTTTVTPTLAPPSTPTITLSPTPTIPVGVPYAQIKGISLNSNSYYVVDYETFEFTEKLPGQHVHFFFNTVTQDQAGSPGKGPWKLYGGPRPFEQYRTVDRPNTATQMCILVANADHSIRLDTGNCMILPDIPVAAPIYADACLSGPGSDYPILGQFQPGHPLLVLGISADETWWVVAHPTNPDQSCWLQRSRSDFSGDITSLPLADAPSDPGGRSTSLAVQINQISLDGQNRYVVEFSTTGFTPALPGTHIHFYFDIYAADQASSGNRLMYGDASPFTGYTQANRPQGATQLCALVANPNHTIIPDSGNCFTLP